MEANMVLIALVKIKKLTSDYSPQPLHCKLSRHCWHHVVPPCSSSRFDFTHNLQASHEGRLSGGGVAVFCRVYFCIIRGLG